MDDFDPMNLPEAVAWNRSYGPAPGLQAYVSERISVTDAAMISAIIFPTFVVVGDCVLIRMRYMEESFLAWWNRLHGDRQEIEKITNHLHLWELFETEGEQEEHALHVLAEQVCVGWHAKASREFPERTFHVAITDEYGPTVSMYSRTR